MPPDRTAAHRLNAIDAKMLIEQRLDSHTGADCAWLLVFPGPPPSLSELRRHVADRVDATPALRRRLVRSPLPLTRPLLVEDPRFVAADHVGEPAGVPPDEDGWLAFTGEALARPLPLDRPLWRLELLPGGDRFALLLRHHHALADGKSGFLILRNLLTGPPCETTRPSAPSRLGLLKADLRAGWEMTVGALRKTRSPHTTDQPRALASVLWMLATDPRPPRVPRINRSHGPRRAVAYARTPRSEIRAMTQAANCFPNDLYLATLAGGLRTWLAEMGVDVGGLPPIHAGTLINLVDRRAGDRLGNHFSGLRVDLAVAEPDPVRRLDMVRASTRKLHSTPLVEGARVFMKLEDLMPTPARYATAWLSTSPLTTINVIASHQTGSRGLTFAGRPLLRLCSWTFLSAHHSLSFVCHTAADEVTINVLGDPDAVGDVRKLADALEAAHRELLAALGRESERNASVAAGQ